jgi:hypothetical protein
MSEFALDEAVALIYQHVVLKERLSSHTKKPQLANIGHICGVLALNDQIEVVVKFNDELGQFNKSEFQSKLVIIKS